jgi:hypothetical protein
MRTTLSVDRWTRSAGGVRGLVKGSQHVQPERDIWALHLPQGF